MELPEITEAKRLTLRPGDVLAIRLDHEPDEFEAYEIMRRVRELIDVPVIVMGGGVDDIEIISADGA